MEKVIKDGKVAVLISTDFGAGWSTWNRGIDNLLLFHPTLVNLVLENRKNEITEELIDSLTGYSTDVFLGGLRGLEVRWIPLGEQFKINEYDGQESIELKDDYDGFIEA